MLAPGAHSTFKHTISLLHFEKITIVHVIGKLYMSWPFANCNMSYKQLIFTLLFNSLIVYTEHGI